MASERWAVGDVSITKVEESGGWGPLEGMMRAVPDATREEVEAIAWLNPTYVRDGTMSGSMHSFLIETPDRKVVVDTGVGNGKQRAMRMFNALETDFLERFAQVWAPDDVNTVICTHLHVDHVGWNTRLQGDTWVPTFPQATYYFARDEFAYWQAYANDAALGASYSPWAHDMVDGKAVFEDSVQPVADAGLVAWANAGDHITPEISLLATPGHTPGHVSVLIESGGQSAVITGDIMHCPFQVARPEWSASLDTDQARSAKTRREFLERFADTPTLVLGTHFGTPTGGHVVRDGPSYRLVPVT
jgi:glyoxylase-like metal-dependent hydrolase (beta-lactamase superfamily II)